MQDGHQLVVSSATTSKQSYHHYHDSEEYWVVGYGFTNDKEAHDVLKILQTAGGFVSNSVKHGKNWIAIKYEDELSAARATSRRVVHLSSILCGITRASPQLMQELMRDEGVSVFPNEQNSNDNTDNQQSSTPFILSTNQGATLKEDDILAGDMHNQHRSGHGRGASPKSFCEKLCYWYFGWDYENEKLHAD